MGPGPFSPEFCAHKRVRVPLYRKIFARCARKRVRFPLIDVKQIKKKSRAARAKRIRFPPTHRKKVKKIRALRAQKDPFPFYTP